MASSQRALLHALECEVRSCRLLALRYFRSSSLRIDRKSDRSPVTDADRVIEERLRAFLRRACPGDTVVGEERGRTGTNPHTYWTVDPIDGTRAFSRGIPTWSILVARVERGRPVLGLCDFPVLDLTLGVAPGVAAYERAGRSVRRIARPRAVRALSEMVILHGGSGWWRATRYAKRFDRLMQACYLERSYGDAYGYLWALRGGADAVIDCGVKLWDMAPLAALARATGRTLVDFHRRPSFTGPEAVFGSPKAVRLVVKALQRP